MDHGRRGSGRPASEAIDRAAALVLSLRDGVRETARSQARTLRLVAELAGAVAAEARMRLPDGPRVPGQPTDDEVVATAVVGELQVVLGVSEWSARETVCLARRLVRVLPDTLDAVEAGRLDLVRAKVLVEATRLLPGDLARAVESTVLPGAGEAPWEGPSPRAWRQRVDRAVVRVDAAAARRRRQEALRQRMVRSWTTGDGCAELLVSASAQDVAMAEAVITDLAHAGPAVDVTGRRLSMDQRRSDAVIDLFRRVRDGHGLPGLPVRRQREIGLVLTLDTLFPDAAPQARPATAEPTGDPEPARGSSHPDAFPRPDDPDALPCQGDPVALDAESARELALDELARGTALNALLVDPAGALRRMVRLPRAPAVGWTRDSVVRAVRDRLDELPPLSAAGYSPTAAIEDHVRARNPRCVWVDCARASARCDLDHDTPWPRGPTSEANLAPRCRRHHETKTRRLVASRLQPDGAVTHTTLTGRVVTTRPEPFPGVGVGVGESRPAG
jgi:hypothetical protein